MKYLKKFNEELKHDTYTSAARKLDKLGHTDRADKLRNWGDRLKWKEQIERFSKFGKFKLNIVNSERNKADQKISGDFHLNIILDRDSFNDSLDAIIEDGEGDFIFFIGIIPSDESTLNDCLRILPDNDMGNGFFWGMYFSLKFKFKTGIMEFLDFEIGSYDESISGDVSFADRTSANRFKTLLKRMFIEPDLKYPSGYNDINYFYDMFNNIFGAQFGLSTDYGLTPELVARSIKKISPNSLYKTIQ